MATTHVNIEQQKSIREALLDIVTNLSPKDRPLMAKFGRQDVKNTTVTWTTDALASRSAANQNVHGNTITFAAADWSARSPISNYTQLMEKKVSVDRTMNVVTVAGVPEGEWERQKKLKLDELLNDAEACLASNNSATAPLPNTGTAGIAGGVQSLINANAPANVINGSNAPYSGTLTKAMYNKLAQLCYTQGGKPDAVFLGAEAKDDVAGWVQQINRPVSDDGKKLTQVINQVETTTGFQDLMLSRDLVTVLAMLETQYWKIGWLRAPEFIETGITGDFRGGYHALELTTIGTAPKSSGIITNLNYAI